MADHNQFPFRTAEEAAGALEQAALAISAFEAAMAPILGVLGRIDGRTNGGVKAAACLRQEIEEHIRDQYPDSFRAVAERWTDDPLARAA